MIKGVPGAIMACQGLVLLLLVTMVTGAAVERLGATPHVHFLSAAFCMHRGVCNRRKPFYTACVVGLQSLVFAIGGAVGPQPG
jgi:hypothetical protein